ncbi:hypothetical protein KR018_009504 [Drosophila ironensis]|nr:hypothetical protein KR018_009504 [Drosophila ironensis]
MQLRNFCIFLVCLICILQVQTQLNNTNVTIKHKIVMLRKLHSDPNKGNGTLHFVIHKVQPGDPYYQVFNGDARATRDFTNKIWRRLLNRYNTMRI